MNKIIKTSEKEIQVKMELSSFAENLARLNSLILQASAAYLADPPEWKKALIITGDMYALQEELTQQLFRVENTAEEEPALIKYFRNLLMKMDSVVEIGEALVANLKADTNNMRLNHEDELKRLEQKRIAFERTYHDELAQIDDRKAAISKWLSAGDNVSKFNEFSGGEDKSLEEIESFINDQSSDQKVDIASTNVDDANMSSPTREEFDAKLETIEARMDGRVASIEGKIDSLLSRIEDRFKATEERFVRLEQSLGEIKQDSKNLRLWLVGTALAAVIGLYSANISMVQTMIASYESGKSMSAAQSEVKRQSEETAAILNKIQDQLSAQPKKQ